jgi:hypothetical protein
MFSLTLDFNILIFNAGDTHSIETNSHRVANPSIGPSIGEVSMAMTNSLSASGSHMDRVGVIRDDCDRDSASNRALAGASLNGSLSGSAVAGPSGFQNRCVLQNLTTSVKWEMIVELSQLYYVNEDSPSIQPIGAGLFITASTLSLR